MGRTTALRRELKSRFFPFVLSRGFSIDQTHAPFSIDFRRAGPDHVAVFDIQWEKYGRPRFVINFGTCPLEGVVSHGERVAPERVLASQTSTAGRLQPHQGARTSCWFRQDRPLLRLVLGERADYPPSVVVDRLLELFPELEAYWSDGVVGPHLRVRAQPWVAPIDRRDPAPRPREAPARYVAAARERAQRRRSPWNLVLLPLGLGLWGAVYVGLFRLVWAFHLHFYPSHDLREFLRQPINLPGFLIGIALLPGAVTVGLLLANAMAWCIVPLRRVLDRESRGHPGTGFPAAMRALMRLSCWTLPTGLLLALAAAYFLRPR